MTDTKDNATTAHIAEYLKKRLPHLKKIVTKSEQYVDVVREIIMGINPVDYREINQELSILRDALSGMSKLEFPDTFIPLCTVIMDLYTKLGVVENGISVMIRMLENETYMNLAIYNMSSSYIANIRHIKGDVIGEYEKYRDVSNLTDSSIFDIIFAIPHTMDDIFDFAVKNEFVVNKFMIQVIKIAIKEITGPRRRRLEQMVEHQKDIIFNNTRILLSKYTGMQSVVYRYNLVPQQSKTQEELINSLGGKYNPELSTAENWKLFSQTSHDCFVINNSSRSPIEFRMDGLVNEEYVIKHDMKTSPMSGLTNKILDRFNTIMRLPNGPPPEPLAIYKGFKVGCYIFESINGNLWRQLSYHGNLVVDPALLTGLFLGLTTRPDNYNLTQSDEIVKKCFDQKSKFILDEYATRVKNLPSSEIIKNKLYQSLRSRINLSTVTNFIELKKSVLDRDMILASLQEALPHTRGKLSKGASEFLITYMLKLDDICSVFIKELDRRWDLEKIPSRTFKENAASDLETILDAVFKTVTTASIDTLDYDNVWTLYDFTLKEYVFEVKNTIV
jgi:hypothetical protein